jgi:hypothetical protein
MTDYLSIISDTFQNGGGNVRIDAVFRGQILGFIE